MTLKQRKENVRIELESITALMKLNPTRHYDSSFKRLCGELLKLCDEYEATLNNSQGE